jgi:hypothetical protein
VVFTGVLLVDLAIQGRKQVVTPAPSPLPVYATIPASPTPTVKPKLASSPVIPTFDEWVKTQPHSKPKPTPDPYLVPLPRRTPDELDKLLDEIMPAKPVRSPETELERVGREARDSAFGRKQKKP